MVITVAIDSSADEARPWIEEGKPTHPSLVDTQHVVPDLYNMVNVPTVLWIDESGRIARPNDVAFADNRFMNFTGIDAGPHLEAVRRWVRGERPAMTADEVRRLQDLPTTEEQLGRTEFDVGWWLYQQGRVEAAERHFAAADDLAPHDFMHRRGTMRLRGRDPMGPEFIEMARQAREAGLRFSRRLPETTLGG